MKNRKLWIISFLVVATVVTGVGYAAVNGYLAITGNATFVGESLVKNDIYESLKFTAARSTSGDNCIASITNPDVGHAADMTVNFKDGNGVSGAKFVATAVYTITYQTNDTTLPNISLSLPEVSISNDDKGFDIDVDWVDGKELAPGGSVDIVVTVTYTNQNPVEQNSITGSISVQIPFATISEAVNIPEDQD